MSPNELATASNDRGFSLIEILIVIVVMGTITSVLSAAFIVVLRASPQTEARLDDARATRALATWLSHDTMSAPPFLPAQAQGGIDVSSEADDCAGVGDNLLHLQWAESSFVSRTFVANYRFDEVDGDGRIVRHLCARTGDGPLVSISAQPLTTGLDPDLPPVVTVDQASGVVASLTFVLNGKSGEKVAIETASRNPSDFFLP